MLVNRPLSAIYEHQVITWTSDHLLPFAWKYLHGQGGSVAKPETLLQIILNTLRPRQNGRHLADEAFKRIFLNENVRISIKISLKFFPKGSINNIPALVQIMAWRRPGDKPLSESMMTRLPTYICVTRPQWVNLECISDIKTPCWQV